MLGSFLSKYSIDELPSLLNTIKGEMNFIGPRPLLMDYQKLYSKNQKRRHNVLPGFNGLSLISGRNILNWEKKLDLDSKYVNEISFFLDLKILIISIFKVFLWKDISTEERFRGNR